MAEKEVRKTAVKKATRRTTTKVVSSKTAVRKTAATSSTSSSSVRKAPARTVTPSPVRRKPSKFTFVFLFFLVVIIGGSIAYGFTDKGSIDVTSVIATRKQNATPEEQERFSTVPVQQGQNDVVNGGLVGTGKDEAIPVPSPEPATTTASTTADTASSTQEVSGEEIEADDSVEAETSDTEVPTEPAIE